MKKGKQPKGFKSWFLQEKADSIQDCPRPYYQLALDANFLDFELEQAAYDWAFYEVIDGLAQRAFWAAKIGAQDQLEALTRLRDECIAAFQLGTPLPTKIDALMYDLQFRAHVVLSKPLNTLYSTSEIKGWNGIVVDDRDRL